MNSKNFKMSSAHYLSNCDIINKYNIKNIYKQPKIKKITLRFFLKDLLSASDFINKTDINTNIQVKSILFFYILFNSMPSISFQNIKTGKYTKNKIEGDFILQLSLSDYNQMNSFLFNLFSENKFFIENSEFELFKKNFNKIMEAEQKNVSYNFKIPGNLFFDINDFFTNKTQDVDLEKLLIDTSVIYSNLPKKTNLRNMIQNLFFFL